MLDATDSLPVLELTNCKKGGLVAEWLACWTQAQKGPGSNRSRKLFTPIVPVYQAAKW